MMPSVFIGNQAPGGGGGELPIKEVVFAPLFNGSYGVVKTRSIAGAGDEDFSFTIPDDFNELVSLHIEQLPINTFTDESIELTSNYGKDGENYQTHVELDSTGVYSGVAAVWGDLDLSSVFSSLGAGDRCGVEIDHNAIGTTVHYKHIHLRYK